MWVGLAGSFFHGRLEPWNLPSPMAQKLLMDGFAGVDLKKGLPGTSVWPHSTHRRVMMNKKKEHDWTSGLAKIVFLLLNSSKPSSSLRRLAVPCRPIPPGASPLLPVHPLSRCPEPPRCPSTRRTGASVVITTSDPDVRWTVVDCGGPWFEVGVHHWVPRL